MSNGGHILRPIKEKEDNTKREPSEKSARKSLPLRPFPKWSMINLELVGPIGETIGNGRFEINWVEVCSFSHSSFASLSLERILYKFHSESGAESGAKMKGKLSPLPIFFPLLSLLLLSFDSTFSVFFFFSFLCVFFFAFFISTVSQVSKCLFLKFTLSLLPFIGAGVATVNGGKCWKSDREGPTSVQISQWLFVMWSALDSALPLYNTAIKRPTRFEQWISPE